MLCALLEHQETMLLSESSRESEMESDISCVMNQNRDPWPDFRAHFDGKRKRHGPNEQRLHCYSKATELEVNKEKRTETKKKNCLEDKLWIYQKNQKESLGDPSMWKRSRLNNGCFTLVFLFFFAKPQRILENQMVSSNRNGT